MNAVAEKIKNLFTGKKNKRQGAVFSQRVQKSGYKTSHLETDVRGKSFWQKWKRGSKTSPQQTALPRKEEPKKFLSPLRLALFSLLVLVGGYSLLVGPMHSFYDELRYFRIADIEISGCRTVNSEDLRKFAAITYEMNMLKLEPKGIENRLMQHPWVKSAEVKRIWPDGLEISILEYRPHALLALGNGKQFSYVSSCGVAFAPLGKGQELDFPVITGLGVNIPEEEKNEMLAAANRFLRLAERNNPNLPAQNISEIHFTETGEMILYLVEHPFPIYFGQDDIKRKYLQLRRVLEVLYRKRKGRAGIEEVAYIRMDYQLDKVLVARNRKG